MLWQTRSSRLPIALAFYLAFLTIPLLESYAFSTEYGQCPEGWPGNGKRAISVISDLHFGVGKSPNGTWNPTEDFRWTTALSGFLRSLAKCGGNNVDLVIAGDLLELWQPTDELVCKKHDRKDLGCDTDEIYKIAKLVIAAHTEDFQEIRSFLEKGTNRLIVIPGNHDAALLLDDVWKHLSDKINPSDPAKLLRVQDGRWISDDGKVIAEHGHQIGTEVNSFDKWPSITERSNGKNYLVRPWGEKFVQDLYNEKEKIFPIIDNLIPESAGVRYYRDHRGFWGTAADFAQFLKFNIIETSLSQKVKFLGGSPTENQKPEWDLEKARSRGHRLFLDSLPATDPIREDIVSGIGNKWDELRKFLDALASDAKQFPDHEVLAICEQIAVRKAEGVPNVLLCEKRDLGYVLESLLVPRDWIIQSHLNELWDEEKFGERFHRMEVFVYGHTHVPEFDWRMKVKGVRIVDILNTGAFQRLIDEADFVKRTKDKEASVALSSLQLEDLPACYASVLISYEGIRPKAELHYWRQPENSLSKDGEFVSPCHPECAALSDRCKNKQ